MPCGGKERVDSFFFLRGREREVYGGVSCGCENGEWGCSV